MSNSVKYTIIDGKAVPVLPAKTVSRIKNKRTGKIYTSQSDFDNDVNDPNTDTTIDDLQQDLTIEVDSLQVFGKTK